MARGKPLGFRIVVIMPDGREVPKEDLTPEEYSEWQSHIPQRLSKNVSAYYSQHPQEFAALRFAQGEDTNDEI